MKYLMHGMIAACMVMLLAATDAAGAHSIAADKIDAQQIYYGNAENFEKPAVVDYTAVVKATPEYSEIKKNKIESTSARYWLLMSSASDHACKAISQVGEESDHDLIVSIGYLGTVSPQIEAEDVTKKVLEKFESKKSGKSRGK